MVYVPGKNIPAPDATSKHPSLNSDVEAAAIDWLGEDKDDILAAIRTSVETNKVESAIIAASRRCLEEIRAVTWDRVRDETANDRDMLQLMELAA